MAPNDGWRMCKMGEDGMRIGFFGGSFDPPHRGHLAVAHAAAEEFGLGRVLVAPTAQQPLKPGGAVAGYADRLEMVRRLCEGSEELEASALDSPAPGGQPNYTVDTLGRLRAELEEEDTIFVIVGVDAFLDLRRWRAPEELLALAEWIVVTRPGFSHQWMAKLALTEGQRERVHLLEGVAEEVSATQIREALRCGENVGDLLPATVLGFIRDHHLYGT